MTKKDNKLDKKEFEIPVIAVIENMIVTKSEVWAYYKLADKPFTFLSTDSKVQMAQSTMSAIGSLCQSSGQRVDCHLLINNQPFNPEAWQDDIITRYINNNRNRAINHQAFQDFINNQARDLYLAGYEKRVTYLGIRLRRRGALNFNNISPFEFGFKHSFLLLKNALTDLFKFNEVDIDANEEKMLKESELGIYNILSSGALQARRVSSEELLLTCKRRLYPAMPVPFLETDYENRVGLSDIVLETGAEIEEYPRYVKIKQMHGNIELEGYRATLSFSKFPKDLMFPSAISPFLSNPIILPFTVNARFSLIPTEEMKKKLYKKKLDTDDEIENLRESGQKTPEGLRNTMEDQAILEQDLENEGLPWIVGSYRVTIESNDLDDLRAVIEEVKTKYSEDEFILTWTAGDQLNLLREELLGGKLYVKDFSQTTNLALLGIAGINHGGSTGDPVKQSNRTSRR